MFLNNIYISNHISIAMHVSLIFLKKKITDFGKEYFTVLIVLINCVIVVLLKIVSVWSLGFHNIIYFFKIKSCSRFIKCVKRIIICTIIYILI